MSAARRTRRAAARRAAGDAAHDLRREDVGLAAGARPVARPHLAAAASEATIIELRIWSAASKAAVRPGFSVHALVRQASHLAATEAGSSGTGLRERLRS